MTTRRRITIEASEEDVPPLSLEIARGFAALAPVLRKCGEAAESFNPLASRIEAALREEER